MPYTQGKLKALSWTKECLGGRREFCVNVELVTAVRTNDRLERGAYQRLAVVDKLHV